MRFAALLSGVTRQSVKCCKFWIWWLWVVFKIWVPCLGITPCGLTIALKMSRTCSGFPFMAQDHRVQGWGVDGLGF